MITRLTLQNFGPFDVQNLDLSPLTLLAGYSYTGKSAVLKAIEALSGWSIESLDIGALDCMKREGSKDKASIRLGCVIRGESHSVALDYRDEEPVPHQFSTISEKDFPKVRRFVPIRYSKMDEAWLCNHFRDYKGVLLLEQPESFLHQREQTLLGKALVTKVADSDVQIVVETHSEHIFNGIRIAIKQGVLAPDNFTAFNFSLNDKGIARTEKVTIEKDGGCNHWPDGLFEQSDMDYKELFGF